ncbi:MAG: TetR-like C-terminal domain-containing protein, partial [Chloroflexi bacterium]|nr:TetR-like C-terminal domain-containing protein [Chloroflexota bacterium]
MLTGDGLGTFSMLLRKSVTEHLERRLPQKGQQMALPMTLHVQLHAASLVTLLTWWLEHDCPYPPAEMIKHINAHIDLI